MAAQITYVYPQKIKKISEGWAPCIAYWSDAFWSLEDTKNNRKTAWEVAYLSVGPSKGPVCPNSTVVISITIGAYGGPHIVTYADYS